MNRKKQIAWVAGCLLGLAALVLFGLCLGRYGMSPGEVLATLFPGLNPGVAITKTMRNVVFNIRLPRVLLALLCGAGLSAAGAGFQALFANPLAAPDTLGVATGASFGAALGILLGLPMLLTQLLAMAFGLMAAGAAVLLSRGVGQGTLALVLAGMVVGALFSALVSLAKYVADARDVLPAITFWLMGSLSGATPARLMAVAPFVVSCAGTLFLLRWRLNALALDGQEAESLGVNVRRVRLMTLAAGAMVTAASVALCGLIGWVGLLVPHAARLALGSDNRRVVPASLAFGAAFLLAVDTIARTAGSGEIPISILTAIIGAPVFMLLLRRGGGLRG